MKMLLFRKRGRGRKLGDRRSREGGEEDLRSREGAELARGFPVFTSARAFIPPAGRLISTKSPETIIKELDTVSGEGG